MSVAQPTTIPFAQRRLSKDSLLQLLTGLLVLAALLAGGAYVVKKHLWAQQTLADVGPRYQRLLGITQSEAQMQQALQRSSLLLDAYTYPAERDTGQIGTDIQQKLRAAFSGTQMVIQSSQVLPEEEQEGHLLAIPVEVRMEGNLQSLRQGLVTLSAQRPTIQIASISLQAGRKLSPYDPIQLIVQARFFVWRRAA
ncbi:general secretion pathway protein GspM [Vandammella animalimorsus]|uniref:General secretion pathway protein GspM n=1 Tax=Vandammella animalimorsus TaxID=2029117 RepID=A0A2A2T7X9_9BURK|nr:GspMb/PilO family protein [Vandammella animalimorsus]PAT31803.1 general secretion pathway protein GspM [Vandammella animalimorsus]PAX17957.1 general secretion pathway protein GspM [Vandammella animalimorsus]PAX20111.1 general secretion pathway protein GspM [Vandammella animalimorsus]